MEAQVPNIDLKGWLVDVNAYNSTIASVFETAYSDNWSALQICNSDIPAYYVELIQLDPPISPTGSNVINP